MTEPDKGDHHFSFYCFGDSMKPIPIPISKDQPMPELRPALLPCPFCGGDAHVREYGREAQWIACQQCHARTDRYGPTPASLQAAIAAWNTRALIAQHPLSFTTTKKFNLGDHVTKTKGSKWTGTVVGTYSTTLTHEGYAVESDTERGSVQIYPAAALEKAP